MLLQIIKRYKNKIRKLRTNWNATSKMSSKTTSHFISALVIKEQSRKGSVFYSRERKAISDWYQEG